MSEVRVGLVGVGFGTNNAKAIARHPRGRMVALCDLEEEKARTFANELGGEIKLYTDYDKMVRDPDIDAICIWTPNQLHAPMGIAAAKQGKHIMVTKPLADSADNAKQLVAAAESAGVVNMMSLSTRFAPDAQHLGKLMRAGHFGEVYYARGQSIRRSGIPHWNLGFIQRGGGAMRDMGIHVLDAAWWIMGMPKPVSVTGVAGAHFGPRGHGYFCGSAPQEVYSHFASDDYAAGFVKFENGAGMLLESFWACHHPNGGVQVDVMGTEAGARLSPLSVYTTVDDVTHDTTITPPKAPDCWDAMADHFIASILDGTPCEAPLRHGLVMQEILEGVLTSASTGREVRLGL